MSQVMHTVRFVVGMSLLAGGAVLAQPLATALIAARRPPVDTPAVAQPVWRWDGAAPAVASAPIAAVAPGGHAIPDQLEQRQADGWSFPGAVVPPGAPGGGAAAAGQGGAVPDRGFVPAPAPGPLPPSALAFAPATPALDGTYRSTVEIPPPPLLDAQSPPPLAVGWSAHDVPRAASMPAAPPVAPAAPSPAAVTAGDGAAMTYVVRDGDDLTSIALTVYGHAGAAAAIWAANADRLSDPSLLPIGFQLRLPPSWTLPASAAAPAVGQPAIEPAAAAAVAGSPGSAAAPASMPPHTASPRGDDAAAAVGGAPWLTPTGAAVAIPAALQRPAPTAVPVARRPGSVRVAAGETLETVAARFYGDRGMAQRIWQVNRDRLRSPDLLVPGMELKLP